MKDSKQVSVKEVFRHQLSFMMESDTDTNHGPLVYNLKSVRIYLFSFIILIKKSFAYGEWQTFAFLRQTSLGRTLISFIHNMTLSAPREYLLTIFLVVESRQSKATFNEHKAISTALPTIAVFDYEISILFEIIFPCLHTPWEIMKSLYLLA